VNATKPSNWFKVALWWPEDYDKAHNDLDLTVIAPNGQAFYSSSTPSIWEIVGANTQFPAGIWKIQVKAFSLPVKSPAYYWTVMRGE
jgi:hypothetical protein